MYQDDHYYLIDQHFRWWDLGKDLAMLKSNIYVILKNNPILCRYILLFKNGKPIEFFNGNECRAMFVAMDL